MAASVSYRINGKYDGNAFKNAQGGLKSLTAAAKSFNLAFKGLVVGKAIQGVTKALNGATNAFKQNNDAQTRLFASLKNNAKIANTEILSLNQSINDMAGYFSGAELQNASSFLSNFGLDKDAMLEALQVAQDLASAGVMPLDQAAKALGQSFSGTATQLGKIMPELKDLTKEQLQNGEAVKMLREQYDGFAESVSNSFSGREKTFNNAFDDLKASFGEIMQSAKFLGQGALLEPIKEMTDFINANSEKIISIIAHLPEIFSATFSFIKQMAIKTFSTEGLKNLVNSLLDVIKAKSEALLVFLGNFLETLGNMFIAFFDNLENGDIGKICWNAVSKLSDTIYKVLESPFNLIEAMSTGKTIDLLTGKWEGTVTKWRKENLYSPDYKNVDFTKSVDAMKNVAKEGFSKTVENLKKSGENIKNAYKSVGDNYTEEISDFKDTVTAILESDLPEDLKKAIASSLTTGTKTKAGKATATNKDDDETDPPKITDLGINTEQFQKVFSSLGDFGDVIGNVVESFRGVSDAATIASGWIGILVQLIGSLVSDLAERSPVVKKFLDGFSMLAKFINTDAVVCVTEKLLVPLMNALKGVGMLLGTFGDALVPLLPVINFLGNVINTIAGVIQTVAMWIHNIIAGIVNWLHDVLPKIFKSTMSSYQGEDFGDLWEGIGDSWRDAFINDSPNFETSDLSTTIGDAVSGGTAASYTAQKDITLNVTFSQSYVSGDAQEIALMIRDEIRKAERLGY